MRTIFREANKPEPTEKLDKGGWVKWGADNNLYPQFLNSLYYDNPVHGGIINQKVKFITAGGISAEGDATILQNGAGSFDLQEVVEHIAKDYEIGDRFCVLLKKSLTSGQWYAEPLDFELIRDTENGIYYDYSDDWSKTRQYAKTGFKQIKSIHYVTEEDRECLMVIQTQPKQRSFGEKNNTLTCNYYPVVNYSGAITSIMAGIEQDYFTYSEVVNSYKGGTLINLANGIPDNTQEEDKIIKRVKNEASKKETQGGLTVTFSDGKDRAPEVHQINGTDLDKRYIESNKEITKKIMIAHGVISPALFGVTGDTMFGSKEEMELAYILFQENYVQARQRTIATSLTWAFKRLNGYTGKIVFNDFIPSILQVKEEVEPTPIEPVQMKAEDPTDQILSLFAQCGRSKSEFKVLNSRTFNYSDSDDEFKTQYLTGQFAEGLTQDQKLILQMIKGGEDYPAISKALDKGGAYLSKQLVTLGNMGMLDGWNVTDKGVQNSVTTDQIEVLYSYEKKPSAPDLVEGGQSRDFCKALIRLDRLYTRQEIDQISAQVSRNVWLFRGGWYHNPDTNVNTPSCRHEWRQNITIK